MQPSLFSLNIEEADEKDTLMKNKYELDEESYYEKEDDNFKLCTEENFLQEESNLKQDNREFYSSFALYFYRNSFQRAKLLKKIEIMAFSSKI